MGSCDIPKHFYIGRGIIMKKYNFFAHKKLLMILIVIILIGLLTMFYIIPEFKYRIAINNISNNDWTGAIAVLNEIENYKNSKALIENTKKEIKYQGAISKINDFDYDKASEILSTIPDFKNVSNLTEQINEEKIKERIYQQILDKIDKKDYEGSLTLVKEILDYRDSKWLKVKILDEINYQEAVNRINAKDRDKALELLNKLGNFKDSYDLRKSLIKDICVENLKKKDFENSLKLLDEYNENKGSLRKFYFENNDEELKALYYYAYALKEDNEAYISQNINPKYSGLLSDEIKKYWHSKYSSESIWQDSYDKNQKAIELSKRPQPKVGMPETEAWNSAWGQPKNVNKTTTANGVHEQWVYSGNRYIYIDDGIVTAIQEY